MLRLKLIKGWQEKGLTCFSCGATKSVKYNVVGNAYCNLCALKLPHNHIMQIEKNYCKEGR